MNKKKWSKFLVAILCLTMSVWALAGCGGNSGGEGEAVDDNVYTASEVTSDLSMAEEVSAYYDAIDMDFAYDLTHELAYSEDLADFLGWRSAGSDSEHKCADFLAEKMEEIGLQNVDKVGTQCDKFQFNKSSLTIKDTDIELTPASYQVNGTDGDLTAEIVNVGTGFEADYDEAGDVTGKIVLAKVDQANEAWIDGYAKMAHEKGAAAIVTWADSGYGEAGTDSVNVQDVCCADLLPTTAISADEAATIIDAIKAGNTECTLNVDAEMVDDGGTTYNVVGMIPGKNHDQKIIVSGHYDKYWYGFQDDCAAIGLVFAVAKGMVDSKYEPENDIYFICHGGEEWGSSDCMYDWTTGAWGMCMHEGYADDVLAMINCELPAFKNENGLQVVSVPEFFKMVSNMYDRGLLITNGETFFTKDNVETTTMEDGISYREAGVPYFLNGFEGSNFMVERYHTAYDDEGTYDADTFQTNIDWYGAYAIYIDTEPALELDLTAAAKELKKQCNADYAAEAGVDVEEYQAAIDNLKEAGKALNQKIKACNAAYEEAVANEDGEMIKKAREEGAALNKTSLEAFQMIQDDFLNVTDFGAHYGHGPVDNNVECIDGTLAGLENGVLWSEKEDGSGACEAALNINTVIEYNYCIFSKEVADGTTSEYEKSYYKNKDHAQWGWNHQPAIVHTGEASYALFHAETVDDLDMDKVTKIYKDAREGALDAIADYCKKEIKDMNDIADFVNGAL